MPKPPIPRDRVSSFRRERRHLALVRVPKEPEVIRRSPRQDTNVALDHVDLRLDGIQVQLDQIAMLQQGVLTALLAEQRLFVLVGIDYHKVTCPVAQALVLRRCVDPISCDCGAVLKMRPAGAT